MTADRWHLRHILGALALLMLLTPQPAWAQDGAEKAAAEALFRQAKALLKDGKIEQACAKFDASQELDRAVGTLLFLGDCNEKLGKLASAWAAFTAAGALAETQGDKRKKVADVRAVALKPRISNVSLKVADANATISGFALRRDGIDVPQAAWNTPLPLDARSYQFEASAPGRKNWAREITIKDGGDMLVVEVPELEEAVAERSPTETTAVDTTTAPVEEEGMPVLSIAGLVVGGAGVVSAVIGGVFGGLAMGSNNQSLEPQNCPTETLCTQAGLDLRADAQSQATVSTATFIIGGVLMAGGTTMFLLSSSDSDASASAPSWQLAAAVGPTQTGLTVKGAW